jgi:hypothetical protein
VVVAVAWSFSWRSAGFHDVADCASAGARGVSLLSMAGIIIEYETRGIYRY